MKEVFASPTELAAWVVVAIVRSTSAQDDLEMAPEDETRKSLKITFEQVERLAREQGMLRAVGGAIFVKQFYGDSFYLKFVSALYQPVAEHMYGDPTSIQISDTRDALDKYVSAVNDPDGDGMMPFHRLYLDRLYHDNENYTRLLIAGIGNTAANIVFGVYELVRNEYFQATQGLSYENYEAIANAINTSDASKN